MLNKINGWANYDRMRMLAWACVVIVTVLILIGFLCTIHVMSAKDAFVPVFVLGAIAVADIFVFMGLLMLRLKLGDPR